ncbi:hypothetical protein [Gorillibacterium sp. CAU 1737]|uniref:hypothetical protein n=1 Tax=Gorillibacterium sp. CAU 1737 TaxID=3140362 RepID=UPI0032610488
MATPQEAIEENQRLRNQVEEVAQVLYDAGEETDLWEALFQKPSGTWNLLSDVFQGSFDEIKLKIADAQNELFDPLLIMWTDDFSRHRRSKNRRWRVVFLATESYEFPVPLLIGTPVDELE